MKITLHHKGSNRGFTLIETLAAILLISVAIVAPMALTVQSIEGAYYARDQITASNLAQEGLEAVRSVRDANILNIALGNPGYTLFQGIPTTHPFEVDGTQIQPANVIIDCFPTNTCGPLATNGVLYGYSSDTGFAKPTNFTRTLTASIIWSDPSGAQEIEVTSTVSWQTAAYKTESVTLSEDLYNWVASGSGA
jgi:prepilin-type N-terminal cleavage/methylation domain-containing protein